jgi:hypothetical protein
MAQSQRCFLVLFFKKEPLTLPSNPDKRRDILARYADISQFAVGQAGEFLRSGPLGAPSLEQVADLRENARMRRGPMEGRLPGEEKIAKFVQRQGAGNLVMVRFSHDTHL